MTYDALVWLFVGFGIGVAASLMLLIGYAGAEQARLGRRLRQARAAAVVEAAPVPGAVSAPAVKPRPAAPADASRAVPVRPVAANTVAPRPVEVVAAPAAIAAPAVVTAPAAPPTEVPAIPVVAKVQSVEALFAEAFANDRLTVAPEPDEQDPPKA